MVPEFQRDSLRELFVYSYRLIYQVESHRVTIIAVVHGHRLLGPFLERMPDEI